MAKSILKRTLLELLRVGVYGGIGAFIGIFSFTLITIELRKSSGQVMEFGDCRITKLPSSEPNESMTHELAICKNGNNPFLWAYKNDDGEVKELAITDSVSSENLVFKVNSSGKNVGWTHALYGRPENDQKFYLDLDFNGQFDVKTVPNSNGNTIRKIYYKRDWLELDAFSGKSAFTKGNEYLFEAGLGWKLSSK